MKGRLIGKAGSNVKALEANTGAKIRFEDLPAGCGFVVSVTASSKAVCQKAIEMINEITERGPGFVPVPTSVPDPKPSRGGREVRSNGRQRENHNSNSNSNTGNMLGGNNLGGDMHGNNMLGGGRGLMGGLMAGGG
eukprot:CAMPEP_0196583388 /NCGR_PEP_ID=MMETSP1081-20130531/43382_1 /TAXON_ID=36882 /ORGANISM="Pyramimonas amylifera, Strain CCMP720" /LENGTH=135 /DNA_ID=CAMNT_0041904265 /DNA_START=50 /DNA_END=453 /DNA_ORIENTATION=-